SILDALEKPLKFASKKDYSNIGKIKALDQLVGDLTLKALSLPLSIGQIDALENIKSLFITYEGFEIGKKREIIKNSLGIIEKLRNSDIPSASQNQAEEVESEEKGSSDKNGTSLSQAIDRDSAELGDMSQIPIQFVKGVGPRIASILKKKGIESVEDALYYFPRMYEDRRTVKSISKLVPGERETVMGKIILAGKVRTKRRSLYQVVISDKTGTITLVWFQFNEKYLRTAYKKGASVILTSEVTVGYRDALQIVHPRPEDIEVIDEGEEIDEEHIHFNRIVPIYPLTEGVKQRRMRRIMKSVVDTYGSSIPSFIPDQIKSTRGALEFSTALKRVHFPQDQDRVIDLSDTNSVYESKPHNTVSYSEFFLTEIGLAIKKRDVANLPGIAFSPTGELTESLVDKLPFDLTSAQKRVLSEIEGDMLSDRPMNRLLQGDVGSGKTIVALLSILKAVESGYQAVLMVPTEILAEQHLASVLEYVKGMGLRVVFLKSSLSKSEKNIYYKAIMSGEAQIAVGTHALIQDKVDFKNLGLVVIDEQHRFGVMQRARLMSKGKNPDVLVMTATPIPRTLALTVYGDLDVSVLDELPPGRKEIKTRVYYDQKGSRERAYGIVRKEIEKGRQAYVVYPMIEESESPDFKDLKYATQMAEELQNDVFPDFRVGLLHGKMKTDEKEAVMKRFISHHLDILVATTVIEVGVDVPNVTVMVVENAERFGLTQLHQLRGRIGRGSYNSYCILISSYRRSEDAEKRLMIMEETSDGFKIAESDLMIRGPGDFLGTKQSGLPQFRFANLIRDSRILGEAREDAFKLVKEDPELSKYPKLLEQVLNRWGELLELGGIS
ncbi:MAG: ATP-dependent DNA helicase RecG, partial [Candidatus Dadabacteria bacterium]|nr:ATP-dependent DNA helicase RecG [Candidatus Dadabacteria bacterium]